MESKEGPLNFSPIDRFPTIIRLFRAKPIQGLFYSAKSRCCPSPLWVCHKRVSRFCAKNFVRRGEEGPLVLLKISVNEKNFIHHQITIFIKKFCLTVLKKSGTLWFVLSFWHRKFLYMKGGVRRFFVKHFCPSSCIVKLRRGDPLTCLGTCCRKFCFSLHTWL